MPALSYAGAWLLMIAAMMLPTTLPVVRIFSRMVSGKPHATRLIVILAAGYAGAWLAFGLAAHALDWMLHQMARESAFLARHGWALGAATLAGAGLFQFSALKYRCLEKCRTPYGFVVERWRGASAARESWRIGWEHGIFCVGCCWALMLLMFVVGMGSVGWMLALAAVMAAEKNLPGAQRLSRPLGVVLLALAGGVLLSNL